MSPTSIDWIEKSYIMDKKSKKINMWRWQEYDEE